MGRRLLGNWLFRLVATAVLLAVIVWRSEPQRIASSFGKLGLGEVLVALVLTIPFLFLKVLRWQLILRNAGSEVDFSTAAVSLVAGMGLALITPARLGEIARIAYLPDPRKLRLSALVLLDEFFDVLVLLLMAVAGAWKLLGPVPGGLFAVVSIAGLIFTYRPDLFNRPLKMVERRFPLGGRTAEVISSLESLGPAATSTYILITGAAFVIVILQFGIILHGPEPHLGLDAAALTFPIVILTNVVPITIAGLGIREGTSVLLLSYYHVPAAVAGVAAFMMFFVNTAVPGFVGALIPLVRRTGSQRTAKLEPEHLVTRTLETEE